MNLWIEVTRADNNQKMLVNIDQVKCIGVGTKGNAFFEYDAGSAGVTESYAEVKQKIEDAMNTYTRLFGNQYVNFPPIKTTTDDLAINKL